MTNHCSRKL